MINSIDEACAQSEHEKKNNPKRWLADRLMLLDSMITEYNVLADAQPEDETTVIVAFTMMKPEREAFIYDYITSSTKGETDEDTPNSDES